jgi:hypothetical protein
MEQPQSQPDAGDGGNANNPIIHPAVKLDTHQQQTAEPSGNQNDAPKPKDKRSKNTSRRKAKRYLLKLLREGPDRHIELLLAFVIALFAYMQWHTAKSNNDSATQQMGQLITAAKISALAADKSATAALDFSSSADQISREMNRAVDRLNAQAAATGDVATAGAATANAAQQQAATTALQLNATERPWVRVNLSLVPNAIGEPAVSRDDAGNLKVSLVIQAWNIGRYPATKVRVDSGLIPSPGPIADTQRRLPVEAAERQSCANIEGLSDSSMNLGEGVTCSRKTQPDKTGVLS